ncbi:MAG: YegS/Rv2252/BmrU family lipid kinase [Abditibacteriaceae bacterium]
MSIPVFINANSKTGKENADAAFAALEEAGLGIGPKHLTQSAEEAEKLLRECVQEKEPLVIVAGGDGALSMAANILAGSETAMAALPMGTGNTFARSIEMPLELTEAAAAIASGKIIQVDVGRVNGRVFLNSVTLGISGEIVKNLDGETKARLGLLSWPARILPILWGHHSLHLKISANGKSFHLHTHQLIISNGRYLAGPIEAAPDASLQDSCLRVFALGKDWKSLLKSTFLWIIRRHDSWKETHYFSAKKLRVESRKESIEADVDGELCESTPLDLEVQEGVLRVLTSKEFESE